MPVQRSDQTMLIRPRELGQWEVLGLGEPAGLLMDTDDALRAAMSWQRQGNRVKFELSA